VVETPRGHAALDQCSPLGSDEQGSALGNLAAEPGKTSGDMRPQIASKRRLRRARHPVHCRHFPYTEEILNKPALPRMLVDVGEGRER
jgi:hypothetical protein